MKRATIPVKSRRQKGITSRQQIAIVAILKGAGDEEAGKAAGVCRQTVSDWRNHNVEFIRAMNIAQNELTRATMLQFKERAARLTDAALGGVAAAIKRGDAATARWWLERAGIDEVAQRLFQQTVDPVILPEDAEAVIDELAAQRVDALLTAKGIGALERLRIGEAMTAKESEALRKEHGGDDAEE